MLSPDLEQDIDYVCSIIKICRKITEDKELDLVKQLNTLRTLIDIVLSKRGGHDG